MPAENGHTERKEEEEARNRSGDGGDGGGGRGGDRPVRNSPGGVTGIIMVSSSFLFSPLGCGRRRCLRMTKRP